LGGVVESAGGGGVALPLLSGGGVVDGLAWSAGGGVVAVESAGAAGAVAVESAGPGEVDCCLEQAAKASALMHKRRRLRFIDHLTVYRRVKAAAAPLQCRVELNVQSQAAFHCSRDSWGAATPRQKGYFLAAARFFFLAGSFGRLFPNEP
jgi:hypothetical protein